MYQLFRKYAWMPNQSAVAADLASLWWPLPEAALSQDNFRIPREPQLDPQSKRSPCQDLRFLP